MPVQNPKTRSDHNVTENTTHTGRIESTDRSDQSPSELASIRRLEHLDKLLESDLSKHRSNPDKLFNIASDLQSFGKDERRKNSRLAAENEKLKAEIQKSAANLTMSQSTGSTRRTTEESDASHKAGVEDTRTGSAIIFSPSDNGLTVRPRRGMRDSRYIVAKLPPFHWSRWSDCFHLYFANDPIHDFSNDQPRVIVKKKKLPDSSKETFIRTIRLGQLGFRFKIQRLLRSKDLNEIYVQSPDLEQGRLLEMTVVGSPPSTDIAT